MLCCRDEIINAVVDGFCFSLQLTLQCVLCTLMAVGDTDSWRLGSYNMMLASFIIYQCCNSICDSKHKHISAFWWLHDYQSCNPAQLDAALVFFPGSVGLYLPTGSSVLHEHYCCYCVPKLESLKLRLVERESQGEVLNWTLVVCVF